MTTAAAPTPTPTPSPAPSLSPTGAAARADAAAARPAGRRWLRVLNIVVSVAAVATSIILAPLPLVGLAIAAASAASVEVLWPLHDQRRRRAAAVTDITHAIGNRFLVLPPVVFVVSLIGPPIADRLPDGVLTWFWSLPWWGQVITVFVLSDLLNYWAHRAMHQIPLLWRFHAVHHSSARLDWLATSRVHPVDLIWSISAASLPAFVLGHSEQQPLLLTFLFLYPFFAHANANLRLPVLDKVIVSPAFHHWHHADEPAAVNKNMGAILSVWDRLFRTAHEPGGYPTAYGIGDPELDEATYAGHLLSPVARVS